MLLILAGCGVVNYISGPDVPAPTAVPTIREVVTVDGSIIVKTSGFGSGLLPQINSGIAAKLIWSDRTDSKIIEAIRIKGKK